ncbi:lanthionine synthetase LanC family protein [Stackebrandtia nassauensis]|nr:lanthionine synthetase LanC family protein [Stackebrandtia nassauensis]
MAGPDGESFDGWATTAYQQPSWVVDPFRLGGEVGDVVGGRAVRLGTHYEPLAGLAESARGNVYTATDVRTGEVVVVKQARAYVAESLDGFDARTQLRNERFVLGALHDVAGVARFRDHFRHGEDEYLVTSFDGRFSLSEYVTRKGRYVPVERSEGGAGASELEESRSLDGLAHRLAKTLRDIHARGFLLRDLSPKNLIVNATGDGVTFIDFGHCNHHDVVIRGGTKGYAPARQFDDEPAEPRDDLHALGMTLFAATIGAEPVVDEDDADASRVMALRVLGRMYGDRPPAVIAAVADLLSADPETMTTAFTALVEGRLAGATRRPRFPAAVVHRRGPGTAALVERVLAQLVSRANRIVDDGREPDPGVYRGAAGIGLCLLPHLERPGVADTVARLAKFSSLAADQVSLRPGLYLGSTGVEVFLRRAIAAGVAATPLSPERLFGVADDGFEGVDVINGAAGIGLGHLLLNEWDPRPEHEDVVRRCLEALGEPGAVFDPAEEAEVPGRDTTLGVSHGEGGVVEFLRHHHRLAPSEESRRRLNTRVAVFAEQVRRFVEASAKPSAVPLCTSWCRGMAGMGRVVLAAGRQLGDSSLVDLAVECADGCLRWLPQLATAGQCCGVAGIGELFCDLVSHDDRFLAAAESAATQLLILNADAPPAPPGRNQVQPGSTSWASGAAGVLDFLTRLRDLTPRGTAIAAF